MVVHRWGGMLAVAAAIGALGVAAAAFIRPPAAEAARLPRYDIAKLCGTILTTPGGNRSAVEACRRSEQSSYEYLQVVWVNTPDPMQRRCVAAAEHRPSGRYEAIARCLQRYNGAGKDGA